MERKIGITQARANFSELVEEVEYRGETYIIDRRGRPAAALVPIEVYELWKRRRSELFDLIRQVQREADLDPEEAERLAAEAVEATRATRRRAA